MKRWNGFLHLIADAALIACGILASACAVPIAFEIPFSRATMFLGCACAALLLSGWMHLKRGGIAPGLVFLTGTIAYGAIRRKMILFGARWILYGVTQWLSRDFSFIPFMPAPSLPDGADFAYITPAVTSTLLMLAAAVGIVLAYSLICGKTSILSTLIPLPTFLLSLVYTDLPPAWWVVLLLLIYCGGALLGQGVRRGHSHRSGWYFAVLVPLLVLFALLIRTASPENSFTPIPFEQRKEMIGERADALTDLAMSFVRRNPRQYDLNKQDDREESDDKAFSVLATKSGMYLMRTRSYGQYRSGVWQEADAYKGEWRSMMALSNHARGSGATLSVKDSVTGERYVPYAFKTDESIKVNESNIAASGQTEYEWETAGTIDLTPLPVSTEEQDYVAFAEQAYTMPDGAQKETFRRIAQEAGLTRAGSNYEVAVRVAAYVKNSGSYTLTPDKVPDGRDFVEYFLTEGHEGYCVHFASATTALLQSLGVPARYTLGYRAKIASPNTWTDVTEQTAHAWTEVYEPGVGWIPIESTSGFSNDLIGTQSLNQQTTPRPTATARPTATPGATATPKPSASAAATNEPMPIGEPTP